MDRHTSTFSSSLLHTHTQIIRRYYVHALPKIMLIMKMCVFAIQLY